MINQYMGVAPFTFQVVYLQLFFFPMFFGIFGGPRTCLKSKYSDDLMQKNVRSLWIWDDTMRMKQSMAFASFIYQYT